MVECGDVAPLDVRHPALADPEVDEQLHRTPVLGLGARLAVGGDIFLKESLPQLAHGGRLGIPPVPRRVLARPHVGDDLGGPGAGICGGGRSMRADRHLYNSAAIAGLDDIDLTARGMDTHAEALEVVVPDHALTVTRLQCIDGSFGDLGHGANPLAFPHRVHYRCQCRLKFPTLWQ